ncbi:TonB-dependent receptor [Alteromonas sp. C1M14]|uniref:TonB-dependent receptor plug domain-containing protein n=1 Tax=Alteromonas sp. C1M14 TaxID=2841567 RepID=UPI001C09EDB4|nr:TonB-dependent receptor [Alteromonas sp. C1M14]MBU2976730.1 TonB-dependent receptor [Alteromonas sp. C1M14]
MNSHINRFLVFSLSVLATSTTAQTVSSETNEAAKEEIENIVVTGTRFGHRFAADSPSPIDSLSREDLFAGGAIELQNMLRVAVPSFNTARPVTSGVADFLQSPTLRGLSTGQTLVLVNGIRRHTNSDLNVGNQMGRGDVAYNFNAIPSIALKRVEILRDGASAQYGSDAVAGIINLILDDSIGGEFTAFTGLTSEGDGEKTSISVGYGWQLGNDGFVRFSGQFDKQEFSDRSRLDTRQQYFGHGGTTAISSDYGSGIGLTPSNGELDPREQTIDRNTFIFGQPERDSYNLFVNTSLQLSDGIELYGFTGYSNLSGKNPNFFRRAGQDQTIRSLHPDGFIPFQNIDLIDFSASAGLRGQDMLGFAWDLSTVFGSSKTDLAYSNSNNVSLGLDSPTHFERGGTRLRQWTTKLDLTRQINLRNETPINVAFGVEYRSENFKAVEGEPASYSYGGIPILDGPNAGNVAPAGAQPAGGTSMDETVDEGRHNVALYVEIEKEWHDRFLVSMAGRYEDYSDFGSSTDYKISTRYSLTDAINLRATVGSSFRAPALPQQFFQRAEVSFATGLPVLTRIVSTNSDLAPLIGAAPLKAETANNLSFGATYNVGAFTASIDAYQISLDDRIVLSSQFSGTGLTDTLRDNGFGETQAVSFLTNAVDTTTKGIDLNASYVSAFLGGTLRSNLAANFSDTKFDRIGQTPDVLQNLGVTTEVFDLRSQIRLKDGTPQSKIALNFKWSIGDWAVDLTNTRYGEVSQADLSDRTLAQADALVSGFNTTLVPRENSDNVDIIETFGAKIVTDLSVAYALNKNTTVILGADNIFDVYPDEQVATTVESTLAGTRGSDNTGIFPYSYLSPFGVAGTFFYGSLRVSF